MIRAFAIAIAIATMRLIFIPALLVAVEPTERQIAALSIGSFAIAFILHAALAEAWLRYTRRVGARGRGAAAEGHRVARVAPGVSSPSSY